MPNEILKIEWPKSTLIHSTETVDRSIVNQAEKINSELDGEGVVALCVMTGGLVYAGKLLPLLNMPVALDALRVTRYRNQTSGGEELHWITEPYSTLRGQTVLLLDDIFDEGKTLEALDNWAKDEGANRVLSAVMVSKIHDRKPRSYRPNFSALEVEDKYVFGMGMDYKGAWRNANGIWALGD